MKSFKSVALAFALVGTLAVASPLYAEDTPSGSAKGSDMTGGGDMNGMMYMMTQMTQMMESCNTMMQNSTNGGHETGRPNEQWRKDGPVEPDKKD